MFTRRSQEIQVMTPARSAPLGLQLPVPPPDPALPEGSRSRPPTPGPTDVPGCPPEPPRCGRLQGRGLPRGSKQGGTPPAPLTGRRAQRCAFKTSAMTRAAVGVWRRRQAGREPGGAGARCQTEPPPSAPLPAGGGAGAGGSAAPEQPVAMLWFSCS